MLLLAEMRSVNKGGGGRRRKGDREEGMEEKEEKGKEIRTAGDKDQSSGPEHFTSASPRSPG